MAQEEDEHAQESDEDPRLLDLRARIKGKRADASSTSTRGDLHARRDRFDACRGPARPKGMSTDARRGAWLIIASVFDVAVGDPSFTTARAIVDAIRPQATPVTRASPRKRDSEAPEVHEAEIVAAATEAATQIQVQVTEASDGADQDQEIVGKEELDQQVRIANLRAKLALAKSKEQEAKAQKAKPASAYNADESKSAPINTPQKNAQNLCRSILTHESLRRASAINS